MTHRIQLLLGKWRGSVGAQGAQVVSDQSAPIYQLYVELAPHETAARRFLRRFARLKWEIPRQL